MGTLSLSMLGPFAAWLDGRLVSFRTKAGQALLAYLADRTDRSHSRDHLMGLLWPDIPQSSAQANLRQNLYLLRQTVPEISSQDGGLPVPLLLADRQTIQINPGAAVEVDVVNFERLAVGTPEEQAQAVALYQGDFLAGFYLPGSRAFEEWLLARRQAIEAQLLATLKQLAGRALETGAYDDANEHAHRQLSLDPLRESACRQLMEALARGGRRSEALRQYEDLVERFRRELGVVPSAATRSLYEAIRDDQLVAESMAVGPVTELPAAKRYQIEEIIAAGGQAELCRGHDALTGEIVAIKRLHPGAVETSPELLARFQQEAELLLELNHPNIIHHLATFEADRRLHIVMEYLPGGSLAQRLAREGSLPVEEVVDISLDLADALTRAHHLGIIHRDLKPANVLLAEDGTPRLSDFGIAHLAGRTTRLTETGTLLGTVDYLSPEMCRGEEVDVGTDLWAMGILLFEMLAGRTPFASDTVATTLVAISNKPIPDLTQLRPDAPEALVDLVYRLLEKERRRRLPGARRLGAELEAIQGELAGRTEEGTISVSSRFKTPPSELAAAVRHNLPSETLPLFGRQKQFASLTKMFQVRRPRMVTLVGPGGIGKTHLALAVARHQLGQFKHGVFLVSLAELESADNLVSAVAQAIGFTFHAGTEPREALLAHLASKEMLLVLDNFEHLLAGAPLVGDILDQALNLQLLVTSRERLGLAGEHLLPLGGLDEGAWDAAETAADKATRYAAVQLFLHCARRLRPEFPLEGEDMASVARICRLVKGLPLGLILAAAWVELLSPEEIAQEIQRSLDFLAADLGYLPERQRSLRAVFAAAWERLSDKEQTAFRRMSVFRGGGELRAVQAVTNASLRDLLGLVRQSLLHRTTAGRFQVHELLRQFAAEHLARDLDEKAATRNSHAAHYCQWLADREVDLLGAKAQTATRAIEDDLENVRAAWGRAIEQRQATWLAQAAISTQQLLISTGQFGEGEAIFRLAANTLADLITDQPVEPQVLRTISVLLSVQADFNGLLQQLTAALPLCQRALDILERVELMDRDIRTEKAFALQAYGGIALRMGRLAEAKNSYEESIRLFKAVGNQHFAAIGLDELAGVAYREGDYSSAVKCYEEARDLYWTIGNKLAVARVQLEISSWEVNKGHLRHGLAGFEQALEDAREGGYFFWDVYNALFALGNAQILHGAFLAAASTFAQQKESASHWNAPDLAEYASSLSAYATLLFGDYAHVQQVAADGVARSQMLKEPNSCFYWQFNAGGAALALSAFAEAKYHLHVATVQATKVSNSNWVARVTACSSVLAVHLTKSENAYDELLAVLARPATRQLYDTLLWTMPAAALLLAVEGHLERAAEVHALAWSQPFVANSRWFQDVAGQRIEALLTSLPPEVAVAAAERGRALDLWDTAAALAAELDTI